METNRHDESQAVAAQLLQAGGLEAALLRRLLERCGDAAAAFAADDRTLSEAGAGAADIDAMRRLRDDAERTDLARRDARRLRDLEAVIIAWGGPDYPPQLAQAAAAPPFLYAQGALEWLHCPQLAMVGSRRPTPAGAELARRFAAELSRAGLTITSGMALGIDAACHCGALDAGAGTVAVLGAGLDRIYPPAHVELARRIVERGVLLSEFPLGAPPLREHFPRRNRVISALALGTLVVEAAPRSGSLITARFAREQNREVFAVPGALGSPVSGGCHQLLREGAKLVENSLHVLEELEGVFEARSLPTAAVAAKPKPNPGSLPDDLRCLLEAIGFEPTPADLALARSRLSPSAVAAALAELEIRGLVKRVPGGYMRAP